MKSVKKVSEVARRPRLFTAEEFEQQKKIIVEALYESKKKMAELRGVQYISSLIGVDYTKLKQNIKTIPNYKHRLTLVAMQRFLSKDYKIIEQLEIDSMAGKLPAITESIQVGIDRKTGTPISTEVVVSGLYIIQYRKKERSEQEQLAAKEKCDNCSDSKKICDDCKYLQFAMEIREADENGFFEYTFYIHKNNEAIVSAFIEHIDKLAKEHNFYKGQAFDAALNFLYNDKDYTWKDLILDKKTKDRIRTNVDNFIELGHIFKANNCSVKRGIIFEGLPGSGKTKCGKILMNAYKNTSFILIPPKHLKEDIFSSIWKIAVEIAPTIIFLEDFDMFGQSREYNMSGASLGDFMQILDGITDTSANIITIATTNKVGEIEKALRNRPGRFDTVIEFAKPTEKERVQIAKLVIGNTKCENLNTIVDIIVQATDNRTPAYIEEIFRRMVSAAIDSGSYDKKTHKVTITVECAKLVAAGFGADSDFDIRPGDKEINEDNEL